MYKNNFSSAQVGVSYEPSLCTAKSENKHLKAAFLGLIVVLLAMLILIPSQALAKNEEQIDVPQGYAQLTDWNRLAGSNRLDTMAEISSAGFASANTAIIAYAYNFPDALSATSLAGYYKAPVLLTGTDSLDTQTETEIKRLGASHIIIVGGVAGISSETETQIKDIDGIDSVERISGEDRFKTSEAIYDTGNKASAWENSQTKTAIIASGTGFADALSMSSYAYASCSPIFLADSNGNLTKESFRAIFKGDFDRVVIAGGSGVVSSFTENILQAFFGDTDAIRIAGQNRYETSSKIVSWCIEQGMSYDGLALAYGENFPDALSGGALCGSKNSVVMLVSSSNYSSALDAVSKNKTTIKKANILGGTGALPTSLYQTFQRATLKEAIDISGAQITISTNPTNNTYTGSPITASIDKVTLNGAELPATAYTLDSSSTLSASNAGSYTITITGNAPDYAGQASTTWTIKPIDLPTNQIPSGLSTTAYTKQKLSNVSLPTLPSAYPGTLSWKNPDESVGDVPATVTKTAIYTPADTNYKPAEVSVSIEVTTNTNAYWIAPAYIKTGGTYTEANIDPTKSITRTEAQITEDMKVLHGQLAKTSDNKDKSALTTMYTNWMNDDSYHLYTRWNGTDVTDSTSANKYIEFRIIQVGQHDNDGSAITFMATHSLPTAKKMNSINDNTTSWLGSLMRETLNSSDGYGMSGLSDLAGLVKSMRKAQATYNSSSSSWNESSSLCDTADKFWLLSYSELFGDKYISGSSERAFELEGSQYAWCITNVTNPTSANFVLANMNLTRAGSKPAGYSDTSWWLRSPIVIGYTYSFGYVLSTGYPGGELARHSCGVVPAFCM